MWNYGRFLAGGEIHNGAWKTRGGVPYKIECPARLEPGTLVEIGGAAFGVLPMFEELSDRICYFLESRESRDARAAAEAEAAARRIAEAAGDPWPPVKARGKTKHGE